MWFQDEARFGQQGTTSRVWAERGSRPWAPRQSDYEWLYVFGAVCPATGSAEGWLMPLANTAVMNLFLERFGWQLERGVHALVVLDRAGWHCAKVLETPDNVTLLHLPPYSPELNPTELVWREARQKKLGNRVYATIDDVDEAVGEAWLGITSDPESVRSLCLFPWIESAVNNWD